MNLKSIRKILLYIIVLLGVTFAGLLIIYPERTINRILVDISKVEFKLMSVISFSLSKNPESDGAILNLVSHRGVVRKGSVENSHQSIIDTMKSGFQAIEIDISFSSDFIPFVFHGPGLELVDQEGQFSDLSSLEITRFKLENGEPIVTLKEFCHLYASKFDVVYLDIKSDNSHHEIKTQTIIEAIGKYDPDNIVLIGYPWRIMREVKNALPNVRIGIEQKGAIANYILKGDMVSLHYRNEFSYAEYKLAKLLGLGVVTWTVNDVTLLKKYSKIYRMNVLTDLNVNQKFL